MSSKKYICGCKKPSNRLKMWLKYYWWRLKHLLGFNTNKHGTKLEDIIVQNMADEIREEIDNDIMEYCIVEQLKAESEYEPPVGFWDGHSVRNKFNEKKMIMLYGIYDYNVTNKRWELDEKYCQRNDIDVSIYEDYVEADPKYERKYMYIILRNDIRSAQKIVQATHATIEMMVKHRECVDAHPKVIVVAVRSEFKLKALHETLPCNHECFHEQDLNGEMTCIATVPLNFEERKFFRKYKLI